MVKRTGQVSGLPPSPPPEPTKTPSKMGSRTVTRLTPTPYDVSISTRIASFAKVLREKAKSLNQRKVTKGS